MIPRYYIYDTALAPEELKLKHPNAATYLTTNLFVTGSTNPAGVVDIANMGFNHPYVEGAVGITAAQLDEMIDGLLAPLPPATDEEVWLSKVQANYLYETRFKPAEAINP